MGVAEYTWSSFSFDVTAPFENKTVLLSFSLVFVQKAMFFDSCLFRPGTDLPLYIFMCFCPCFGEAFLLFFGCAGVGDRSHSKVL